MADLDLLGLSADEPIYLSNSRRIRTEFHEFSDVDWRKGRRGFLSRMLSRDTIYHTAYFHKRNDKARMNMRAELDWLLKFGDAELTTG